MTEKQLLINEMFKLVSFLEHNGDFIFEQFGLTVKTYWLLYMISTGINTSRDLLNGTYGSKPNMTKKIKSLEEWWFIFREVDNQDKRVWRFYLTHKSIKIMEDIHPVYEQWIECMFENISHNDLNLTLNTITKILSTLEKMKCEN